MLDNKHIGQIAFRLGSTFQDAEISLKKAKDLKNIDDIYISSPDDFVVIFKEDDMTSYMNLSMVTEGLSEADIEDIIFYISSWYISQVPTSHLGRKRLEEELADYEHFSNNLFVYLINKDADMDVKKQLDNTSFAMAVGIDIKEYCKEGTSPEDSFIPVTEEIMEIWGITKKELFNQAINNTGDNAYSVNVSSLFNEPLSDKEADQIEEFIKKTEKENSMYRINSSDGDGWDDYKSEWDSDEDNQEERTLSVNRDEIKEVNVPVFELHGKTGFFGSGVICDTRFMNEMCSMGKSGAGYILPFSIHECLFIPDLGYKDVFILRGYLKDLYSMANEYPILSNKIIKYSVLEGYREISL